MQVNLAFFLLKCNSSFEWFYVKYDIVLVFTRFFCRKPLSLKHNSSAAQLLCKFMFSMKLLTMLVGFLSFDCCVAIARTTISKWRR